jgi:hypothetical protein
MHPISLKQFSFHYSPKVNKKRYIEFTIKKKSGVDRKISAPNNGLKEIQYCLNTIFQSVYNVNSNAFGFVQGKSIVDNARIHINSIYVYNIDLKDFFPSIEQARIWGRLQHPPFNLNEKTNRLNLANIIASFCCHEMEVERLKDGEFALEKRNVLPQGAPTSPILSNIICERLDVRLNGVAKRFGLKYSRYADDITFSSMHNVFQKNSDFLIEINRIINEQNFLIKDSKTRLQKQGYRQEVTGLIINQKPNVDSRYISELRKWIYLWEKYGLIKANSYFTIKYIADKGHVKKAEPRLENVLAGKLEFLKMVRGADNEAFKKLNYRFVKLCKKASYINDVLLAWESDGIEKAMSLFYLNLKNEPKLPKSRSSINKGSQLLHSEIRTFNELKKYYNFEKLNFNLNNNIIESKWQEANFNEIKFLILSRDLENLNDKNLVYQKNINTWVISNHIIFRTFTI